MLNCINKKGIGMKNRMEILEIYEEYKNKLKYYENLKDTEKMGYVSEKAEVLDILSLLEYILEEGF